MRRILSTMARAASNPRRFAPLNGGAGAGSDLPKLRGIVFDVDGTLWWVIATLLRNVPLLCFYVVSSPVSPMPGSVSH